MHYANEDVIWIDLPRGRKIDEDMATLLEDIKDGLIISAKYQGTKKMTRGVKVLVTTNNWIPPEAYKSLTKDRWDILVNKYGDQKP